MVHSKNRINRICYVYGFYFDTEPPEEKQSLPFIYCPCCCFEYGINDLDRDCLMNKRNEWINQGLKFGYKLQPDKYV
jgi:hypothetical protein